MEKIAAILLIVGLVIGAAGGFGGAFVTQLSPLQSENEALNSKLSSSQSDLAKTQTDLSSVKANAESLTVDLSKVQTSLSEANDQIKSLDTRGGKLQSSLSQYNEFSVAQVKVSNFFNEIGTELVTGNFGKAIRLAKETSSQADLAIKQGEELSMVFKELGLDADILDAQVLSVKAIQATADGFVPFLTMFDEFLKAVTDPAPFTSAQVTRWLSLVDESIVNFETALERLQEARALNGDIVVGDTEDTMRDALDQSKELRKVMSDLLSDLEG